MRRSSASDEDAKARPVEQARASLTGRMAAKREEIEQSILDRASSYSGHLENGDPEYAAGIRTAVSTGVSYCLDALRAGEEGLGPLPPALLTQARLAARNGVTLETVLRRYFAGYTLLVDFLMEAADGDESLDIDTLHRLGREQAALFESVVSAVTTEYLRESEDRPRSVDEWRLDRVTRLLAGELLDTSQLGYELDGWHLGLIIAGEGAAAALQKAGATLGRPVLVVQTKDGHCWAWLGGRRKFISRELDDLHSTGLASQGAASSGEPAYGLSGWRLTHRQARAALPIARLRDGVPVRYSDVVLLASIRQDELGSRSLQDLFLTPLEAERDRGVTLRETLRAYFAAERNVSSAAAALGVSRRTVANRLQAVEGRIGRPIAAVAMEIEAALRLDELDFAV